MKPSQTIFNKDQGTVTISVSEYNKLKLYREYALEMKEVLRGGDSECVGTTATHPTLNTVTWLILNAHTTTNAMVVNMTVVMIYEPQSPKQTR